jgi:hypothetical protein
MRIGAALVLIAVGAILRFALVTVVTHGIYLHTIGDILMGVGVLGLILWAAIWGPWARNRRTTYRQTTQPDGSQYTVQSSTSASEQRPYEDQYPS